jgi:hypothetical protein
MRQRSAAQRAASVMASVGADEKERGRVNRDRLPKFPACLKLEGNLR